MVRSFKHGLKIADVTHKDFELRRYSTADLFAAEDMVPTSKSLQYQVALASLQLVRVGTFTGPFTLELLRDRLHPDDIHVLMAAQRELEGVGE